ncbi:TetR/AcrR family transcriptional regulator [Pseudomonas sp. R2.Fl]|nr:TetR/AcrR family transcriptional regulator [Pseudomonas sp. R2.Fl]
MNAHQRRKQPEKVRRMLLDAAARIATRRGIADVTVDAVCLEAGVTKGAFFHHYPNKAALVRAVFDDLIERFEAEIAERMAEDDEAGGRFSRAYISAVTATGNAGSEPLWAALCVSTLADADLRRNWGDWLDARLEAHGEAGNRTLRIARAAADGLWLDTITGTAAPLDEVRAMVEDLHAMTRKTAP